MTFSSGRKSPGCRAERLHWGPQGLPAPHKLPGRGAERPPRNKHTPGTARQAVGPRTKPIRELGAGSACRESGAASCRREMGAGSACRREGKAKIKKEPGRESGAASCRREHQIVSQQSNALSAREKLKQKAEPRTRIASRLSLVVERPQPTMNTLRNWSGHPQVPLRSHPAECHQL